MTPLFKKLNFKNHPSVLVLQAPSSFENEEKEMAPFTQIAHSVADLEEITFVLVFVLEQRQIEESIKLVFPKLKGDAVLWFCYPKGSSKKYQCDFNRDTGWQILGEFNLEGVRQVAIDEDWSALRFRKVEYIKTLNRRETMALSETGKKRTAR